MEVSARPVMRTINHDTQKRSHAQYRRETRRNSLRTETRGIWNGTPPVTEFIRIQKRIIFRTVHAGLLIKGLAQARRGEARQDYAGPG